MFNGLSVEEFAAPSFRTRVENYVKRTRASILAIQGEDLAERVFQLYFSESPPFAERKEKKAEFPDAVCLVLLEDHVGSSEHDDDAQFVWDQWCLVNEVADFKDVTSEFCSAVGYDNA